jgi:hypothetical protein
MAFEFDLSELDAFASDLKGFDFVGEVQQASKAIQGTLRMKRSKGMMTLRSVMDLDDSLMLGGDPPPPPAAAVRKAAEAARVKTAEVAPLDAPFVVGSRVWAKYEEDGLFYEASVLRVVSPLSYVVLFTGYGNEQETSAENMRPFEELQEHAAAVLAEQQQSVAAEATPVATDAGVSSAEIEAEVAMLENCFADSEAEIGLAAVEHEVQRIAVVTPTLAPARPVATAEPMPAKGVGRNARDTIRQRNEEKKRLAAEQQAEAKKKADADQERWARLEAERSRQLEEMDRMFEDGAVERAAEVLKEQEREKERRKAAIAAAMPPPHPRNSPQVERKSATPPPAAASEDDGPPPPVPVFDAGDAASELAKFKGDKARVEEMEAAIGKEMRAVAQKKLLRAQMRQEVLEESVAAVTAQRQAIRLELRAVTLLAKKTALSCGRLPQFFGANVRDMTAAAKTVLTLVAILMQQTQFKSLASKLHVQASELQREVGRLIMHFKHQHEMLAARGAEEGADVSVLAAFAGIATAILAACNEVVAATEHSAAVLRTRPDPLEAADDARAEALHAKLGKARQALALLDERIRECEARLIVRQPLPRGSGARQNPSRRT